GHRQAGGPARPAARRHRAAAERSPAAGAGPPLRRVSPRMGERSGGHMPWLARVFGVRPCEAPAVAAGLAMFFLLFTGYFMLRPVREAMGVAGGVDNLQWLFTGTFVVTLAILPLFGWVASRVPRRRIAPWVFGGVVATLLGFGAGLVLQPEHVWAGRAFFIWVSVINMLLISL